MPAEPPVRKTVTKPMAASAKLTAKSKAKPAAPKAPAVKVKLQKPVVDMIKWMNESGDLATELRLGAVAIPLSAISTNDCMEILQAALEFPSSRRDPIGFVKEAAKAVAAQAETQRYEQQQEDAAMSFEHLRESVHVDPMETWNTGGKEKTLVKASCPMLPDEVSNQVFELCSKGLLPMETDSDKLGAFLHFLGEGPSLELLVELSQKPADDATEPAAYITKAANSILVAERGSPFAMRLSKRLRWMQANLGFLEPLRLSEAAFELSWLGEPAALQVVKRMAKGASEGHLFAEPTEWLKTAARRLTGEEKEEEPSKVLTGEEKEAEPSKVLTGEEKEKEPSKVLTGEEKEKEPSKV